MLELHLSAWSSLAWGASHLISKAWMSSDIKPPRLVLGKTHGPTGCPEKDSEEMLPIPASPVCSPLYRCKHAMKWGETFVNQICSCFITLLISILIFVRFCFQSIQLEVQLVHTLVFGKGIHEAAPKAPPCHFPCDTMHKSGSSPRQQGERRGTKVKTLLAGQITDAQKQVPRYYAPASLVFSPPSSHLAACARLIKVLLVTSCKSLIMMLCRYQPISEPARSMPLDAISQPDHGRPPAAHMAFQPAFNPWDRLQYQPGRIHLWSEISGYIHFISFNPLMLWRFFFFS